MIRLVGTDAPCEQCKNGANASKNSNTSAEGVCIGSSLTPALSDLLLACFDRDIEKNLSTVHASNVFRYFDDCLVLVDLGSGDFTSIVQGVLDSFSNMKGPSRTKEMPDNDALHFLDLLLLFKKRTLVLEVLASFRYKFPSIFVSPLQDSEEGDSLSTHVTVPTHICPVFALLHMMDKKKKKIPISRI